MQPIETREGETGKREGGNSLPALGNRRESNSNFNYGVAIDIALALYRTGRPLRFDVLLP